MLLLIDRPGKQSAPDRSVCQREEKSLTCFKSPFLFSRSTTAPQKISRFPHVICYLSSEAAFQTFRLLLLFFLSLSPSIFRVLDGAACPDLLFCTNGLFVCIHCELKFDLSFITMIWWAAFKVPRYMYTRYFSWKAWQYHSICVNQFKQTNF